MHTITLIPGDGIGPEVTAAAVKVIEAAGIKVKWHTVLAGQAAVQATGTSLPDETIDSMRENRVALKGPLIVERGEGSLIISREGRIRRYPSVNNAIRREVGAFVNVRPIKLVMDPTQFDVVLAPNQYGDIISDLCAGLVGSLGLAPGANIGVEVSYFEAVHGAAPDIAGQDIANPVAMILSGAMMLDHVGEREAAGRIRRAVESVLEEGHFLTPDIGGGSTTSEMTQEIIRAV